MEHDASYFLPQCKNSGIKNHVKRLKDSICGNIASLKGSFSNESQAEINKSLSEIKISSIHNILSRLVLMNEHDLLQLEDDILAVTKVENNEASVN